MTKEQDWQKAINQLVVTSAEFPFIWKQKVLDVAAQLNHELTNVVLRASHPPEKVFANCPKCYKIGLEISGQGCKCISCNYTDIFPGLETDLDDPCPNCGEPTKIVSEDTCQCITCNHFQS